MHSYTGAFPEGVQITLKDSPNSQTHLSELVSFIEQSLQMAESR